MKIIFITLLIFVLAGCTSLREKNCLSNTDCQIFGKDYYCQVNATDYRTITSGTCQKVSELIKENKVSYHKRYLTLSNKGMNWFSANNWCEAQGMKLVQLSDFNISQPKEICYFPSQKEQNNYCDLNTETKNQLRDIFGNKYYYWTQNSDDPHTAFGMCFINNYVRPLNKEVPLRHAVCIN